MPIGGGETDQIYRPHRSVAQVPDDFVQAAGTVDRELGLRCVGRAVLSPAFVMLVRCRCSRRPVVASNPNPINVHGIAHLAPGFTTQPRITLLFYTRQAPGGVDPNFRGCIHVLGDRRRPWV